MTDEQWLRHAMDYEVEPWTPNEEILIRGARRLTWVRRGVTATAALAAAAGTAAGVALAVGGPDIQPPVSDNPPATPYKTPTTGPATPYKTPTTGPATPYTTPT